MQATHKGGHQRLKQVTQVQQQRPESPTVTLTWHARKSKVHKLRQKYILCMYLWWMYLWMYLWWSSCTLYLFTRMPGESYRRRLRSLLFYLCYLFQALINSLVCCFQTMTGLPRFLVFRCTYARYTEPVFIRLATCTRNLREEICFLM